jgi:universal stress protein A
MKMKAQNRLRTAAKRRTRDRGNVKSPTLTLGRILVPLDFSGKSRQALDLAVPLSAQYGGKIILLHVVQPPAVSAWHAIPGGGHYLGMKRHNLKDAAHKRLKEMAFEHVPARLRGQTIVLEGTPYEEITSMARRLNVELIVISTRGLTGLKGMLIGSTAERVVRHAHCPVLIARRH